MSICMICNSEVEPDEIYIFNGKEVCEDCAPVYANPPRPCSGGPLGQQSA